MKTTDTHSQFLPLAVAWLLACSLGGCACHGECNTVDYSCYAVWPCFGYQSTCWRPWPEECVTCPSPYSALPATGEVLPGAPLIEGGRPELPMPMPPAPVQPIPAQPVPIQPMPEPPTPPANPRDGIEPQSYQAPLSLSSSQLQPAAPHMENSSRRRSTEANYSLDSLRWAPTNSP